MNEDIKKLIEENFKFSDDDISRIGCIVCLIQYGIYTPAIIHHIRRIVTSKKRKLSPRIPLCTIHHNYGGIGVSVHDGRESFERNFGTEIYLLERTNRELKNEAS